MLVLGMDVTALAAFGIMLVFASCVVATRVPMTQEQGDAVVASTAMTALLMVIAYIAIACILNAMVG